MTEALTVLQNMYTRGLNSEKKETLLIQIEKEMVSKFTKNMRIELCELLHKIKTKEMAESRTAEKGKGKRGRGRPRGDVYIEAGKEIGVTRRPFYEMVRGDYAPSDKTTYKLFKALSRRESDNRDFKLILIKDILKNWNFLIYLLTVLDVGTDPFFEYLKDLEVWSKMFSPPFTWIGDENSQERSIEVKWQELLERFYENISKKMGFESNEIWELIQKG